MLLARGRHGRRGSLTKLVIPTQAFAENQVRRRLTARAADGLCLTVNQDRMSCRTNHRARTVETGGHWTTPLLVRGIVMLDHDVGGMRCQIGAGKACSDGAADQNDYQPRHEVSVPGARIFGCGFFQIHLSGPRNRERSRTDSFASSSATTRSVMPWTPSACSAGTCRRVATLT